MVIKMFYLHSAPEKLTPRKSYVKIDSTQGLASFGLDPVERSVFIVLKIAIGPMGII